MDPVTAYIALGGNVGNCRRTFRSALAALDATDGVRVVRVSSFIETDPVGPPGQGPYLNGAAELDTTLPPRDLLAVLHEIEATLGRDRAREQHWGPRTCDLDLLLYGDLVMDTPDLKLPHPRMHSRRFVLAPLAEIAPHAVHPVLQRRIIDLLTAL